MYHNRWKNITNENFERNKILFKGFIFKKGHEKIVSQEKYIWKNDKLPMYPEGQEVLESLIKYIKKSRFF